MAYVEILSTTTSSIRVQLSDCDTTYGATDRVLRWYLNGSLKTTMSLGAYVSSGAAYTFSGLSSGTRYDIKAAVTNTIWDAEFLETAWTDSIPVVPRPSNWNWSTAEVNAFNNNGLTTALSRVRWNAFLDKINEFVSYVNTRDSRSFSNLPSSCYMGADKKLYASSFNVVVNKIKEITRDSMSGITIPRSTGDPIKGVYFPYMSSILNTL